MLGARPASAEAAVNSAIPTTKRRRRPNRSPSAEPVSRSTANVSVKALTVHSSAPGPAPKPTRMLGSAVATTSLSRAKVNQAMDATTKVMRNVVGDDIGGSLKIAVRTVTHKHAGDRTDVHRRSWGSLSPGS